MHINWRCVFVGSYPSGSAIAGVLTLSCIERGICRAYSRLKRGVISPRPQLIVRVRGLDPAGEVPVPGSSRVEPYSGHSRFPDDTDTQTPDLSTEGMIAVSRPFRRLERETFEGVPQPLSTKLWLYSNKRMSESLVILEAPSAPGPSPTASRTLAQTLPPGRIAGIYMTVTVISSSLMSHLPSPERLGSRFQHTPLPASSRAGSQAQLSCDVMLHQVPQEMGSPTARATVSMMETVDLNTRSFAATTKGPTTTTLSSLFPVLVPRKRTSLIVAGAMAAPASSTTSVRFIESTKDPTPPHRPPASIPRPAVQTEEAGPPIPPFIRFLRDVGSGNGFMVTDKCKSAPG
jgi:hypothetical protein